MQTLRGKKEPELLPEVESRLAEVCFVRSSLEPGRGRLSV